MKDVCYIKILSFSVPQVQSTCSVERLIMVRPSKRGSRHTNRRLQADRQTQGSGVTQKLDNAFKPTHTDS